MTIGIDKPRPDVQAIVLIRGHGNVVVGATVPWVVLRALYTQINARTLLEALAIDRGLVFLNHDEIK